MAELTWDYLGDLVGLEKYNDESEEIYFSSLYKFITDSYDSAPVLLGSVESFEGKMVTFLVKYFFWINPIDGKDITVLIVKDESDKSDEPMARYGRATVEEIKSFINGK